MFRDLFEKHSLENTLKMKFPNVIFRLSPKHPPEDGENCWHHLGMVLVKYDNRNQGIAGEFMRELVSLAQKEKCDIFLTPDASYQEEDGMSLRELTNWYQKLGFKKKRKSDFRSQNTYCYYSK